jgi:hypothetical protein
MDVSMELSITHDIDAPLAAIEAALLDPQLLARLPAFAAAIASAREFARRVEGDVLARDALYVATFVPAPLVPFIPRAWATWIERTAWDRRTHSGSFVVEPQIPLALRRRVTCRGTYTLRARGRSTRRTIAGELRIDAPLIGRRAERVLARVIEDQFAGEAALLAALARAAA